MQDVLEAQGKAVEEAKLASKKTEEAMDDVKVEGDLPEKEPPDVPDGSELKTQADDLATKMGSGALGCECSAQLYGDASTTEDTRVSLMSKKGHLSHTQKVHTHHKHKR